MDATIFDGSSTKPCTVAEAQAAANQPGISWIDLRLHGGDADEASAMLQAVGIDGAAAQRVLSGALGTEFSLTPAAATGVCWLDDNDGTPAVQVYFSWTQLRLVTVRADGDAAVAEIRQRVNERVDVLTKHPSTLLGVVLQLMLASVQRGVTQTGINVGTLDMEIIATQTPNTEQTQKLNAFRTAFQPLALRFPMYVVNVQAALIDPGPVDGMDDTGMAQMQQFLAAVQGTSGLIGTLDDGIRNAAQDIQAQVSNWQGNRINVLTIVTMIFLPISFLTGYFGMNFTWLDDQLDSLWSYILLGVVLPIVLVLACVVALSSNGYTVPQIFRRKRKPTA